MRDVRTSPLDAWWRDARHAVRSLRATPAFTLVALLVLTISIGATTAIFSLVDGVVLRALPFPDADRLVAVGEVNLRGGSDTDPPLVAPQNFLDWRAQQRAFTGLAAVGYAGVSLPAEPGQEPETLEAQAVSAGFFAVLGVPPLIGRAFTADHEVDGHARVAVISYRLWQRRFGGAPDIVGRSLRGQLGDFEILGVMPPSFGYPVGARRPTDVWLPLVFRPEDRVRGHEFSYRLQVIGRLADGVSIAHAQAEMNSITAALAAATPRWFEDRVARVEALREYLTGGVRTWMLMLLAAAGFVLLIACVNVANLLLVRASARNRELVIRSALGASRWDLGRALLAESLLLSLVGGALGTVAAWFALGILQPAIPADVPRAAGIAIDLRVLIVTLVVSLANGLLFGTAPILQSLWRSSEQPLTHVMRTSRQSARHHWLRSALVVMEVALAVMLLVGSGLFLASFARVSTVDLGMDPTRVLTVRIRPLVGAKDWDLAQRRNRPLLGDVLEDVRRIPGVDKAALVNGGVPLRGDLNTIRFGIPGRVLPPDEDVDFNAISPEYFRALRVPLLNGRFFEAADRAGSEPVVIVNEAAARKYFPGQDPIGQTVEFLGVRRVVGVVGNIRHDGPEADWRRQGFVPLDQSRAVGATLVLRLTTGATAVLPAVKVAIWSRFPDLALPDIQTLSEYLNGLIARRRFNMLLLTLFGLLGVVIACIGVYGVMAYVVGLRTHEIGIRLALGAVPAAILWSVLRRALLHLAGGLAAGLAAAWMLAALVSGFLFQVQPHEGVVYLAVSLTLVAAGVAAAFIPARRAARVDPLIALRAE